MIESEDEFIIKSVYIFKQFAFAIPLVEKLKDEARQPRRPPKVKKNHI